MKAIKERSMKKVVSILILSALITAFAVSLCGCGLLSGSEYRKGPAMWVVEDQEGHTCYLFGSVHVGNNDGLFPFSDIIEDAFAACDQLALEYDIIEADKARENMTEEQAEEYVDKYYKYSDGTAIKDHLSENTYNAAVEYFKSKNIYDEELESYNATYWYMLAENLSVKDTGAESENGVDLYFAKKAYAEKKPVVSIESEQSQLDMLLSLDDKVYDMFILSTVQSAGSVFGTGFSLRIMFNAYKNGNMSVMESLIGTGRNANYGSEELNAAMKDYDKKMYTDRNRVMADAVKQFLSEDKRTFVVVGCAHMLGSDGIVSLLASEGYKVCRK